MRFVSFAIIIAACGGNGGGGNAVDSGAGGDTGIAGSDGSGGSAGSGTSPGTGTGTLVVTGSISAASQITNASDPASFTADFEVRVQRAGSDVTTGDVTVTSAGGAVPLVYDPASARWHGAQASYATSYELDVSSGSDDVTGVTIAGPAIHTITAPTAGATVDSTMALAVTWAPSSAGDQAAISTRDLRVGITDTGSYALAPGTLRSKPDQIENDNIDITRSQSVVPAGGAVGSLVAVSVDNGIDLVIQPTGSGTNGN